MSFLLLLAFTVSDEKLDVIQIMKCVVFLWLLSKYFLLSLVFSSLIVMCLGVDFCIYCIGVHWSSWICFLPNLENFFCHYNFKYLSCTTLFFPVLLRFDWHKCKTSLVLYSKSLRLCLSFFILIFFSRSDWIISVALSSISWTLCLTFSILLLSLLKFPFACSIYIYFLRLPFYWFQKYFSHVCWSIFIIAPLKSLSDNSNLFVIFVLASVDWLFPCKLKFSWFFICQVILNDILDILNIKLWDCWS